MIETESRKRGRGKEGKSNGAPLLLGSRLLHGDASSRCLLWKHVPCSVDVDGSETRGLGKNEEPPGILYTEHASIHRVTFRFVRRWNPTHASKFFYARSTTSYTRRDSRHLDAPPDSARTCSRQLFDRCTAFSFLVFCSFCSVGKTSCGWDCWHILVSRHRFSACQICLPPLVRLTRTIYDCWRWFSRCFVGVRQFCLLEDVPRRIKLDWSGVNCESGWYVRRSSRTRWAGDWIGILSVARVLNI